MPGITLATFSCGELKKIKTFTELPGAIKKEKVMTYGLTRNLKKVKDDNKKIEKKFFNCLLNICVMNGLVDWSDKDPKKEFKQLGELLIVCLLYTSDAADE